jgi:PrtD family type I secretion system ABC transporter
LAPPRKQNRPPQARLKSRELREAWSGLVPAIGLLGGFSIFINLLRLTIPLFMMQVVDRVLSSQSEETLIFITLIAVVALLVSGVLVAVSRVMQSRMGSWFESRLLGSVMRAVVVGKLTDQSMGMGGVRDLGQLKNMFSGQTLGTLFELPWTPIFLIIIWILNPWLGALATGFTVLLALIAILNDYLTTNRQKEGQREQGRASKGFDKMLANADTVHAMGMTSGLVDAFRRISASAGVHTDAASERGGIVSAVTRTTRNLAQVGILSLGAYLALEGDITTGIMIAGSILQNLALSPIDKAAGSIRSVKGARQSFQRVNQQLASVDYTDTKVHFDEGQPLAVSMKQAMYMPQGAGRPVLRPLYFDVAPGEMLGILGPGASGKSSLCRLLVGVVAPTNGSVTVNDLEVSRILGEEFGALVGYLPQEPSALDGTIAENISRFYNYDGEAHEPDAEDSARMAAIVEAAKKAGVHEMILGLPRRYETMLDDTSAPLSRSQLQRIYLARTFYGNPRLLVLDEPATFLDKAGEQALATALVDFRDSGATVIVVSQRPQIINACDKLLLLREGTIVEYGDPQRVLNFLANANEPRQPQVIEGGSRRRAG